MIDWDEFDSMIEICVRFEVFDLSNLLNISIIYIYIYIYMKANFINECRSKNKNNIYIGYTPTTLSLRLTYHLSENSAIKQLIIKHNNSTDPQTDPCKEDSH